MNFDLDVFIKELKLALVNAVESLDYGLDCRVQSHKKNPSKLAATFPTINISIGYAYKHDKILHRRLLSNKSTNIVEIDYSLNEPYEDIEVFNIDEKNKIKIYGFTELVAEKFRAIIQQKSRKRKRRQDVYDIYFLLRKAPLAGNLSTKRKILNRLIEKSQPRELIVIRESLSDPEIIECSRTEYGLLSNEIEEPLPDFDEAYSVIKNYYESLPWENLM